MGLLMMNKRERLAKAMMEMVKQGKIKLGAAAEQLVVSYSQAKRIYRRYKAEGDAGLVHKARGRASSRRHPHQEAIIARYQERYLGFGPTLAAEYLAEEDGLIINHETLRRLLIAKGLWSKQRHRSPHRRQRECRAQFGELLQIDGSIHDWLEEGRHTCLLNMVDDATGKTLSYIDSGETTRSVFIGLQEWINQHGIPLALYVDFKSVYVSSKSTGFSHVQRACNKLGIRIIKAHSAQAKGRVERNHAVYQDRLVKEFRLRNVKTIEDGNKILSGGFIDKLNKKFERVARNPLSAHRPLGELDLNEIFCWEYERQIQHDWTFSFSGKCYQITKKYGSKTKPKVNISVRKHLDGAISAWYGEEKLTIALLEARPKRAAGMVATVVKLDEKRGVAKRTSPWIASNHALFEKKG